MKRSVIKKIVLMGIIFSSTLIKAQTNTFPQSGNVGIGTLSPVTKLNVIGNTKITGTLTTGSVSVGNDPDGSIKSLTFNASISNEAGQQNKSLYENGFIGEFAFSKNDGILYYRNTNISKNAGYSVQGADLSYPFIVYPTGDVRIGNNMNVTSTLSCNSINSTKGFMGDLRMWRTDNIDQNANRALVNYINDDLWINFGRDFTGGVRVQGNTIFEDKVLIGGTAFPANSSCNKLNVNGTIGSTEVRVSLTNWCDYVFEDSYKLKPLAEVEKYIQAYKHLPEVPSEAQVVADGLAMGEMMKIHMKKIEELTLYMIELQKQNEKLAAEVAGLKK